MVRTSQPRHLRPGLGRYSRARISPAASETAVSARLMAVGSTGIGSRVVAFGHLLGQVLGQVPDAPVGVLGAGQDAAKCSASRAARA